MILSNQHRDYIRAILPLVRQFLDSDVEWIYPLLDPRAMAIFKLLKYLHAHGSADELEIKLMLGIRQESLDDILSILFMESIVRRDSENKLFLL
jgi:hypothetical protein